MPGEWPCWLLTEEQEFAKLEQGKKCSRESIWGQSGVRERVAFREKKAFPQGSTRHFEWLMPRFFKFSTLHPKHYLSISRVKTAYALIDPLSMKKRKDST